MRSRGWGWLQLWLGTSALLSTPAAFAQEDWFLRVRGAPRLEVRIDERVFALSAAMNAAGYDAGPVARTHPFVRFAYPAIRQRVRDEVARGEEGRKLSDLAGSYFDTHPQPLGAYLAAVLQGEGTPLSQTNQVSARGSLPGLDAILSAAHAGGRLRALFDESFEEHRRLLFRTQMALRGPWAQLESKLGQLLPASRARSERGLGLVLVVDALQASESVHRLPSADDGSGAAQALFVVAGAGEAVDVERVLGAYAEAWVRDFFESYLEKKSRDGSVRQAARLGTGRGREEELAREAAWLVGRALALEASEGFEALEGRGEKGDAAARSDGEEDRRVGELRRRIRGGKPLESWAGEWLVQLDAAATGRAK